MGFLKRINTVSKFMNEAVEKLTENFIRMILAPLHREVIFTKYEDTDSLP